MCGICGAVWSDPKDALAPELLQAMTGRLKHRGPDDSGTYRDRHAALGFRRLSIIDVAGGHQPIANETGSVQVVFNGEIYNYLSLRHRLEARGHVLRTRSDSEILPHLYEDEGTRMFALLRGMFALAVWDAPRRTLVLARDRLGQKPLVYRRSGGRLAFASELKALLALPGSDVPRTIDPTALDHYLCFGHVPAPRTILEGTHKLLPAHFALWREDEFQIEPYWRPDWNARRERPIEEDAGELRATLESAVREQMIADVPLGAFLSGGIDSTIITGLMQAVSDRPVKTFAIGFPDPKYDETYYAELAARRLGTEHETFRVEPRAWETLPHLARQFDEPFADSSALPTWHVARLAREHVTVALTGDAGDELFGGYERYRALALTELFRRHVPGPARRALSGVGTRALPRSARSKSRIRRARRLLEHLNEPAEARYLGWMTTFDEPARLALYSDDQLDVLASAARRAGAISEADPAEFFGATFAAAARRGLNTRAMVSDLLMYLPNDLLVKVDLASMAHGLECRAPFLDHRVVELAAAMPARHKLDIDARAAAGRSKIVLKRAFADLLPPAVRRRPKMGFGVPIGGWFRNELKDELQAVLLDPVCLERGLFRPGAVRALVAEHVEGRADHAQQLWALLMLEMWFRTHSGPAANGP